MMKSIIKSNVLFGIVILILTLSFPSCIPEYGDPKPYNYIIEGPQDMYPAFSPDGEDIAYFHDAWDSPDPPGYPDGLYIIDKDGGNRRLVLPGDHWSPAWSPDGEWLVFTSGGVIRKCQTNGDSLTTFSGLDHLDNPGFYFPDWSSDGRYILFDKPFNPEWGFYYMTSDFQNSKRSLGIELLGRNPELSPNGELIAYQHGGNNIEHSEIFISDTLGMNQIRLTENNRDDRAPTWSPVGEQIAWSSSIRLCVMNADGTDQREIAFGNDPSWSVNNAIVYSHANADYTKEVLYTISPDGKNKQQITF